MGRENMGYDISGLEEMINKIMGYYIIEQM